MGACPFHHFPKKNAVMTARLKFLAASLTEFLWKKPKAQTRGSHSLVMALMRNTELSSVSSVPGTTTHEAEPLRRTQSGSKPAPGKWESPSAEQVDGKERHIENGESFDTGISPHNCHYN